mmetsp:Transcript_39540/g.60388  ORF Transcript_39540/g.60388 Transcript_39540/m.60388 type:complete len:455 (-) Transcript_39540:91-1455(-)
MVEPELAEFVENGLGLLREGNDEAGTGEASAVSDRPGGILEAVEQSLHNIFNEGSEGLGVDHGDLSAKLANAVAGSLTHSMVISLGLRNIELANGLSVFAEDLLALLAMDELPSLVGVDLDSFSHVVPVEAHPRHEHVIVFFPQLIILLGNHIERTNCLRGSVSNLRPVVRKSLGDDGQEIVTEGAEPLDVLGLGVVTSLEDESRRGENGVNHEVGDFPDKTVDMIHSLNDGLEDLIQVEIVESDPNSFDDVLQNPHRSFERLPALSIMHGLTRLIFVDLDLLSTFQGLAGHIGIGRGINSTFRLSGEGLFDVLEQHVLQSLKVHSALNLILGDQFLEQGPNLVSNSELGVRHQLGDMHGADGVPDEVGKAAVDVTVGVLLVEVLNEEDGAIDCSKPIFPSGRIKHDSNHINHDGPGVVLVLYVSHFFSGGNGGQDLVVEDVLGLFSVQVKLVA